MSHCLEMKPIKVKCLFCHIYNPLPSYIDDMSSKGDMYPTYAWDPDPGMQKTTILMRMSKQLIQKPIGIKRYLLPIAGFLQRNL